MRSKVVMSREAVTARIKLACGLGDAERVATMMMSAMVEIQAPHAVLDEKLRTSKRNRKNSK
jgi:hypothetical protein